jgi:hypothetical protein
MKQPFLLVFGGVVLAAAIGCSEDPSLYPGGPAGASEHQRLSSSRLTIVAGDSVVLGARAEDAVGNPTGAAPTVTSCESGVAAVGASAGSSDVYATSVWVRGAGLGETCLLVSSGGLTDSVQVTVGPASVSIVGDPIVGFDNQDPTANFFEFSIEARDVDGNVLTGTVPQARWKSSNTALFYVDPVTGIVRTKSLGTGTLQLVTPTGANAVLALTVGAPLFSGTASASQGGQGDLITITRTDGPEFDSNTEAYFNFGGVQTFIDGAITSDQVRVVVPATGVAAGRGDIVLRKVGPDDLDRRIIFEATTGLTGHRHSPASDACTTAPAYATEASPEGWVYFSFTNTSVGYGGPNPDVWFNYTNTSGSAQTVDVRFEWLSPSGTAYADADLFVYLGCGTPALDASQNYNPPDPPVEELTGLVVPAGESLQIKAVIWDAQGAAFSNARIRVQ